MEAHLELGGDLGFAEVAWVAAWGALHVERRSSATLASRWASLAA
jgi:hypothetical protein